MSLQSLLRSLQGQFHAAMGSAAQVKADCSELREILALPGTSAADLVVLRELAPLLRLRGGEMASWLFAVIDEALERAPDPLSLLQEMLHAREETLAARVLDRAVVILPRCPEERRYEFLRAVAKATGEEDSPLAGLLDAISLVFRAAIPVGQGNDSVVHAYLREVEPAVRLLAARLLDHEATPVPDQTAEALLGAEEFAFLQPYIHYTRASHQDLLSLASAPGGSAQIARDLSAAESVLTSALLREVIANMGWPRLNLGLKVRACAAITIGDSLPIYVSDAEAALLAKCAGVRRDLGAQIVTAHGGPVSEADARDPSAPIQRFRSYNLTHADVLTDFLDVAPLTAQKVRHLFEHMDKIVEDYAALFSSISEECAILPELYENLKTRILGELNSRPDQPQLSMELTRLVQMFEDPKSLGGVGTLHGLKRYLHQKGLQLGSKLMESGSYQDRTIDVVICAGGKIQATVRSIRYSDFEPETTSGGIGQVPASISMVADAFSRQALLGQRSFPSVRIFCYGNEVHYYLTFRNHPAFLRIDYSPPLRGGMIDLEYYGVSKYELADHPDTGLAAIRTFFRRLDFDLQVENSRIHARYDKERAGDLDVLCEKARMAFCLSPYLMELDWIAGSLRLSPEARLKALDAWAEFFARWGALPYPRFLTSDRRDVLREITAGPSGEIEVAWPGEGAYQDRYSTTPPPGFLDSLRALFRELGITCPPLPSPDSVDLIGQEKLEQIVLKPIRAAIARGQILASTDRLQTAPAEAFQESASPAEFAGLLASGVDELASAVHIGHLISPLERTLRFRTTGAVEGWNVQVARLPLRSSECALFILRDTQGMIRMGFFIRDDLLFRSRKTPASGWESNRCLDPGLLASLLRRNNYIVADPAPETSVGEESALIADEIRQSRAQRRRFAVPEKVLRGIGASPGQAVGRVVFGTAGRAPENLDGAVLVSPAVRPEDTIFLYHAAAIVSTGGGILSHAGLIALQFRKPSLVIEGRWQLEPDGSLSLRYLSRRYREREETIAGLDVVIREDEQRQERALREGDLVAINATDGIMTILGQETDVLSLHDGFRQFAKAGKALAEVAEEQEQLAARGRRLRARHQIEKILRRLNDRALAEHAVGELFLGDRMSGDETADRERTQLLRLLLTNPHVGETARGSLKRLSANLRDDFRAACDRARHLLPSAASIWDVLELRSHYLRLRNRLDGVQAVLRECGISGSAPDAGIGLEIDRMAAARLQEICAVATAEAETLLHSGCHAARLRHLHGTIVRVSELVGCRPEDVRVAGQLRFHVDSCDEASRHSLARRRIVLPADGGLELGRMAGLKAANLAEIERLAGTGLVPPWFAVTDFAFQEVLDSPLDGFSLAAQEFPAGTSVRQAIDSILGSPQLNGAEKSSSIRRLWEEIPLPDALAQEVAQAYLDLAPASDRTGNHHVAIRSSGREEDTETASRAGEFETYLFIAGVQPVLQHLKRTWSGLWTERAIHHREVFGTASSPTGGGVIVQRIVWSRACGVIQTVNASRRDMGEMVINAGNGLGEGIVSGTVAADQITVAKDGNLENGMFRFRYVTADKRERVVFHQQAGQGTVRVETLYHQRLRPALEYAELCELVQIAARLEKAYGYPLDIEFGIEGARLWLLQARPVPTVLASLRGTRELHPFPQAHRVSAVQEG
jgi:phosphohistidine swiveling domain-containing protein